MSRSSKRAFTLIELLVVIAILAALLALVAPAVSNIGKARSLAISGNKVAQMATLARQNAMAKNVLTALVLLKDHGTEGSYRAFTVIEHQISNAIQADGTAAASWHQITNWETLATGCTVDLDEVNCSFLKDSPDMPDFDATQLRYLNSSVSEGQVAYRMFLPSGGLSNPDRPAQIRLVEGYITGSSGGSEIRYTRPASGAASTNGPANFYDISIVGTTGAVKIARP
jgi:prepilin-type N-terminal cleavage/methylation domain-containing protein